jgi:hypothetical protein
MHTSTHTARKDFEDSGADVVFVGIRSERKVAKCTVQECQYRHKFVISRHTAGCITTSETANTTLQIPNEFVPLVLIKGSWQSGVIGGRRK